MASEALCVMEKYFPPSFFDISIHLVVHLADEALTYEPVRYRWMYPFERAMKSCKNLPSTKLYVEGSIEQAHLTSESAVHAMEHLSNAKDGNHRATQEAFLDPEYEYSDEGPVYGDESVNLSNIQFIQIRRWVLFRREIEGVAEYYSEYCDQVSVNSNGKGKSINEVERKTNFIKWLYFKLEKEGKMNGKLWRYVKGPVRAKQFDKYRVNSYMFSPKCFDEKHVTQDSEVWIEATTTFRESSKDKNLQDQNSKYYGMIRQILEVDYTYFTEVVFYYDWVKVESKNLGCKLCPDSNMVVVNLNRFKSIEKYIDEPAIMDFEAKQIFYSQDLKNLVWSVVIH